MAVEIEYFEGLVVARLDGDIDHHGAKGLRDRIDNAVISGGVRELELDFRDVSFMDSSGIGLVMGRYRLMQELGGTLRLVNVAAHFRKVMVLAGLDRLAIMEQPPKRAARTDNRQGTGEGADTVETDQFNETAI